MTFIFFIVINKTEEKYLFTMLQRERTSIHNTGMTIASTVLHINSPKLIVFPFQVLVSLTGVPVELIIPPQRQGGQAVMV